MLGGARLFGEERVFGRIRYRFIIKKCQIYHVRMVAILLLSTASLFHVGKWKSRSALLEREVPERLFGTGSAPLELEVMN